MDICSSRPRILSSPMPVNVDRQENPSPQVPWSDLPEGALHAVFAQVRDGRELARYSLVNKTWQTGVDHPQLWQAVAKAMRLPDSPLKACRTAVERARIADANMRKGRPTKEQVIQHQDLVRAVAFSPDGSKLATGSHDSTARLSDVHTGATLATFQHQGSVWAVAFSFDGSQLATGSDDRTVRLTDYGPG